MRPENNDLKLQVKNLYEILKSLKQQQEIERQKEEFRKKYENYKKLAINEKQEKEAKMKELEIYL